MASLPALMATPQAQSIEARIHSGEFIAVVKTLMGANGNLSQAVATAQLQRMPDRVQAVLKAAIASGSTSTWASLTDYQTAVSGFLATMRSASAFDAILPQSLQLPLHTRIVAITSAITATLLGELQAKPVSRLQLAANTLEPSKCGAEVVLSKEIVKLAGPVANQFVASELRGAVSSVTDSGFFQLLLNGVSSIPSSGTDARAVRSDIATALDLIHYGAGSALFIVVPPSIGGRLALMGDSVGGSAFPQMTPLGGAISGVTTLVSDGVPAGSLIVLDAKQIAMGSDNLDVAVSMQASVQLSDSPDSPPLPSTNVTSLWQHDLVAVRLERLFAAQRIRDTAVAAISSISYGNSPA